MSASEQMTRSASLVGLYTLASRILGLVRDAVLAAYFPKRPRDAFFVAHTIPNVLRRLTGEGALTIAFIPVFTEYLERQGRAAAQRMLASMLGSALIVLSLLTALGVWASPWIVKAFAYGFTRDISQLNLAILLTRIMFVFVVTTGLTALAMGVLNTCRHFAAPALAPVILNIGIIATVLGTTSLMANLGLPPILAAALGVVVGGLAQALFQLPFLARYGMLRTPRLGFSEPGVIRVGKLMLPAVFGLAIYEINVILARLLASFLEEGAISYLYFSQRLIEFPMGVFAVAIATVAMPNLSSQATAGDLGGLKETYRYAMRMVFFIVLPATAGLAALALPLTAVLFQRGQFSGQEAAQTAITLLGFLAGLWASAGVKQTVPVFYALQDTKTPVKVAALSLVVYASLALLSYRSLGTLGLALAVSGSSLVNFVVLVLLLRLRLGLLGLRKVFGSMVRSGIAAAVCGVVAHLVGRLVQWDQAFIGAVHYGVLLLAVVTGLLSYLLLTRLLGSRELAELTRTFRPGSRGDKR